MKITAKEIELATGGKLVRGEAAAVVHGVSTDTRADCRDMLFIPLVGANFDGHDFVGRAFEKGASVALTARDDIQTGDGGALIRVGDTLAALGKLAAWYRLKFDPVVVAITGSVGKTTTKEMVALVLSRKYNVLKSVGNYNNEIGLPLTVFRLTEEHTALVLEMGMNNPGEIARLSKIARPDIAVITNIGYAHIERFGSKQNILKAKLEIIEGMEKNGTVFLNGDDTLLKGLMGLIDRPIVYYGIDDGLDVVGSGARVTGEFGLEFEFVCMQRNYTVKLEAAGEHNIHNALAAISIGLQQGVPPEHIARALAEFRPGSMRLNIVEAGGVRIIDDTYNASVQSMKAALDVLCGMETRGRKVAVLGDMLELGAFSEELHCEVGAYAASRGVDLLVATGERAGTVVAGAREMAAKSGRAAMECRAIPDREEARGFVAAELRSGDAVLVKGSRAMAMERIVNDIKTRGEQEKYT